MMEPMENQTLINGGLAIWVALLSFFGLRHRRRDVRSYREILAIIASLQATLNELREELDRVKPQ